MSDPLRNASDDQRATIHDSLQWKSPATATPDAGDVDALADELMSKGFTHRSRYEVSQWVLDSDWLAARLDAARAEEGKRIAQAIRALPTMGKFAPGVWVVRESAARIAEESR